MWSSYLGATEWESYRYEKTTVDVVSPILNYPEEENSNNEYKKHLNKIARSCLQK